ncbi:alpha/beta hydrolase [Amycolatopsis acidicola]|uniref:Alpha/beta hydrolase n=1 Tax=Amycolatopsis acidicola TaxID=2596893 RepID=A0A5N0UWK0_9PSEU|nr:alpha/beta hydrolase [Amycolatopsis acidicola]KAA9155164.1 alpha/beta hydrolase [Amycolatopsis acidicola]
MTETVLTADLEIAYEVSGPAGGRPLVAVHGWPDDPHCWDGLLPHWHRDGYRVFRPYLRGFGPTRFRRADKPRSGQIGALGRDLADFLAVKELSDVRLIGHDWGARAAYVVGALFPDRVRDIVAMSAGYASSRADIPLSWPLHHAYWYEWLVATGRGRRAVTEDRREFCRYLWRVWAPSWKFDAAEFDEAAAAWDNEDWAPITVHAYMHRWGEAEGDSAYADIERQLAEPVPVQRPTLVLHGGEDADNLPETSAGKEKLFTAGYRRVVLDGVGHFPPREAPERVAAECENPPT